MAHCLSLSASLTSTLMVRLPHSMCLAAWLLCLYCCYPPPILPASLKPSPTATLILCLPTILTTTLSLPSLLPTSFPHFSLFLCVSASFSINGIAPFIVCRTTYWCHLLPGSPARFLFAQILSSNKSFACLPREFTCFTSDLPAHLLAQYFLCLPSFPLV